MNRSKGQLTGFFYPQCFVDPELLKQMMLYFDRIYVVKPAENLTPEHAELFEFWETTKVLQEEELLVPIRTGVLAKEPPPAGGPDDDTAENPFPYAIAAWNRLHCLYANTAFPEEDERVRGIVSSGIQFGIYSWLVPSHGIPITNSEIAQDEFYHAYSMLLASQKNQRIRVELESALKCSLFLSTTFERMLPSLSLRSYHDLLEAKYRLREELSLCSRKLAEVAEQMVTNPITSEHEFKAQVNENIDAALIELERKLQSTNDRFLRKALQEAAVGTLAIYATIASGLPWPLLFLLSSLKNVVDQIGDLLDAKRQIREENGLSLLLSLRNRV